MEKGASISIEQEVQVYDVDLFQVVWNGNYLRYFEAARTALFAACGVAIDKLHDRREIGFPVIRNTIKYIRPLTLGDRFITTATVREARTKIVIDFVITLAEGGQVAARGVSEQATLNMASGQMEFWVPRKVRTALMNGAGKEAGQ